MFQIPDDDTDNAFPRLKLRVFHHFRRPVDFAVRDTVFVQQRFQIGNDKMLGPIRDDLIQLYLLTPRA